MSLFIIVGFVTGIFFGHILEKHHAFDHALEIEAKQVRKKFNRYRLKRMRGIFPHFFLDQVIASPCRVFNPIGGPILLIPLFIERRGNEIFYVSGALVKKPDQV